MFLVANVSGVNVTKSRWSELFKAGSIQFPLNSHNYIVIEVVEGPIVNHSSSSMKVRQYLTKLEVQSNYKLLK